MKKPKNRSERIEWITRKLGHRVLIGYVKYTDREVKQEFELMYKIYKDKPDYDVTTEPSPTCVVCESEVEVTYTCLCTAGCILDKDDPAYEEHKRLYENGN